MPERLFIADLHLDPQRPATLALFIDFCRQRARQAEALYILGDFLEIWWGDDDPAEAYQAVFDALRALSADTRIFLMHGNRDFMIGQALAERCGFQLIDEPWPLDAGGKKAMLIHGDSLCTDDVEYQQFRQMVRNPQWQQQVMQKSLEERHALAQSIRAQSKSMTALKAEDIMDVNPEATRAFFIEHGIDLLIHGHTHRPAFHDLDIDGRPVQRIVLGDWGEKGNYLAIDDQGAIRMHDYPD